MENVLIQAAGFILVICIGFFAKKLKILKKEDGYTIATIIMNITLPCALFTSASGITIDVTMLCMLLLGIVLNLIMIMVGYMAGRKGDKTRQAAYMINCSGYNIGNFTLPFAQSFFPGLGVGYLCMLDVGNAMMCLGGTYALASGVANTKDKISFKSVILKLVSSIPFDVYIMIFFLSLFHITLPAPILSIASYIGNANGFLVMLMIGLLLEIKMTRHDVKDVIKILLLRFGWSIVLVLVCFYIVPLPLLARKILALSLVSPVTTMATVFSKRCGYERDMPAVVNSLSIMISIVFSMVLLMLFV